jgi:hypothetical protein
MMKFFKYGLLLLALLFLAYNSVYFEKLSDVRAQTEAAFDYRAFADSLYYQGILKKDLAVELSTLLEKIAKEPESAFEQYGNRLGIGNSAYFMIRASGVVSETTTEGIQLYTEAAGPVEINTRYIFGNALRDASGLVELTDFKTNAEFNRVSEALNTLVRTKVIPPIVEAVNTGDSIAVVGAIKLSKKELDDPVLLITPSQITLH